MRWPIAALFALLAATPAIAQQTTFPYKAYATADDVYVRSGPGDNYYPTDKLKAGQEVEVYRHDPGGWYAIRPPVGSFSWVAGRHLDLRGDNLATVLDERVAARVGSRFSDVRDVIQVRLHRGEAVEVLDAKRNGSVSTTAANTWYKISPPSGEFRWVSGRFVAQQSARDGVRKTAAESTAGAVATVEAGGATVLAMPTDTGPAIPRRLSAEQFQQELSDIDVELSTMVVEEPSAWEFGELKQRAESLLNQAETAVERGRARLVVAKIARFDDIKQRYAAIGALRQRTDRADRELARISPRPRGALPTNPGNGYDAAGKLVRVPSPKVGAPQYALVDEDNKIRCYVTPAPGVNLSPYLNQQVGISGTRGYITDQRARHLMARHISVVEGSALR